MKVTMEWLETHMEEFLRGDYAKVGLVLNIKEMELEDWSTKPLENTEKPKDN